MQRFISHVTARGNYNVQDLREENERLSSELEELQREVDAINELKSRSAQQDADIAHYEDYFQKMQKHKRRKEVQCQKLSEDLISKESELKDLREMMVKKQAAFDAQGFDGKKQLSYFESQKTDLQEKLQAVQAKLKDVQNQCWDLELQQSKAVDQGNSVCEEFNKMYSRLNETSRSVLEPLSTVTDPQVRNICSSFKLDFPDYRMVPTQACLVRDRHERKAFLEKLNKKIKSANLIFKGMATQQNQKLNEVRTENDKLSLELKVIKSQEQSKERELSIMEKQVVKEVNGMEAEVDDMLQSLQQVQAERAKAEEENAELKGELKEIVELKKNWQKKLDDYLEEQKKLFEFHKKSIEKIEGDVEKQQEKILATMEKYLKD